MQFEHKVQLAPTIIIIIIIYNKTVFLMLIALTTIEIKNHQNLIFVNSLKLILRI